MKRIPFISSSLVMGILLPFTATAEVAKCLILIHEENEGSIYLPLSNNPTITFPCEEESNYPMIQVVSNGEIFSFNLVDINRIELKDVNIGTSSVKDISVPKNISIKDGNIVIEVNSEKTTYSITGVNGIVYKSGTLSSGTHIVSLSELGKGIFIIKLGEKSLKISIR